MKPESNSVGVRKAQLSDVARLGDLVAELFNATNSVKGCTQFSVVRTRRNLSRWLDSPSNLVAVLELQPGGQPVGLLVGALQVGYFTDQVDSNEILWWITPAYSSLKGARLLLSTFLSWSEASHAKNVLLTDMTPDQRLGSLYRRQGLQPIQTTYGRTV